MAAKQVQIRKNFIEDVFMDGGSGVNIITKILKSIKTKISTL
jgi:hypothetical protein